MTEEKGEWPRGCVQVYTGDGKGKTTAALGLALRAAGAGLPVFIAQFCKGRPSGEHEAVRRLADLITLRQYGARPFITGEPTEADRELARRGLSEVAKALHSGDYRVVIADEINAAVDLGLVSVGQVLELVSERPAGVELVLTGRKAAAEIVRAADLVTEMRAVKHPYHEGLAARRGIEE